MCGLERAVNFSVTQSRGILRNRVFSNVQVVLCSYYKVKVPHLLRSKCPNQLGSEWLHLHKIIEMRQRIIIVVLIVPTKVN
jgi:hypothetical protein